MLLRGGRRRTAALLVTCTLLVLYLVYYSVRDPRQKPWLALNGRKEGREPALKQKLRNPLHFEKRPKSECNARKLNLMKNTFYAVRTHSDRIWTHLPLQINTALKQFKNHAIFSDSAATVGATRVIDILATLDAQRIETEPSLKTYRLRRYGNDQDWGWGPDEYEDEDTQGTIATMLPAILMYMRAKVPASTDWYVLVDESSYISPDALLEVLSNESPDVPLIMTWGNEGAAQNLLWSRAAFDAVLRQDYGRFERKVTSGNISSTVLSGPRWCEPVAFFYDLKPWELQSLYDRSIARDRAVTQADFYRDYVLPFIRRDRQEWEIFPSGPRFVEEIDNLHPREKKRHCKRLCERSESCVAWQWRENVDCQLETEWSLRRGAAMNQNHVGTGEDTARVSSGFFVDRIRNMRNWSACDPLHISPKIGHRPNDNEHTSEGYLLNERERLQLEASDVLQALKAMEA